MGRTFESYVQSDRGPQLNCNVESLRFRRVVSLICPVARCQQAIRYADWQSLSGGCADILVHAANLTANDLYHACRPAGARE